MRYYVVAGVYYIVHYLVVLLGIYLGMLMDLSVYWVALITLGAVFIYKQIIELWIMG